MLRRLSFTQPRITTSSIWRREASQPVGSSLTARHTASKTHQTVGLLAVEELLSAPSGQYLVLDARRRHEYEAAHIPGAVWIGWEEWTAVAPDNCPQELEKPGYWGVLAEPDGLGLGERLAKLGLSNDQPIAVYANAVESRGREARIAWMLLYFGALRVCLLDGGWSAWQAAKATCTSKTSSSSAGHFVLNQREERRIRLLELRSRLSATPVPQLIDTRTVPEFQGDQHSYMPRTGRLPGAVSLPFTKLFTTDGSYIPPDSYKTVANALLNREFLVSYCEVGVRACIFALLHEAYTGEIVPVYDGSMMEWSLDQTVPVERGRAAKQKYC